MIEYLIIIGIIIIIGLIILAPRGRNPDHIRSQPKPPDEDWDKSMAEARAKAKEGRL